MLEADRRTSASGCVVFAENGALASGDKTNDFGKRMIVIIAIFFVALIHPFIPRWGVQLNVRMELSHCGCSTKVAPEHPRHSQDHHIDLRCTY